MNADYDFLISQAREILSSLEPLFKVFRRDFINRMVADLVTLAALICGSRGRPKDEEIFFMTVTLFVLLNQKRQKGKGGPFTMKGVKSGVKPTFGRNGIIIDGSGHADKSFQE